MCPDHKQRSNFLGCVVKASYPLGPVFHGSGLNTTVMSLNGKLGVGIISCPDLLPDLWELADDFPIALDELLERTASQRQRKKKLLRTC